VCADELQHVLLNTTLDRHHNGLQHVGPLAVDQLVGLHVAFCPQSFADRPDPLQFGVGFYGLGHAAPHEFGGAQLVGVQVGGEQFGVLFSGQAPLIDLIVFQLFDDETETKQKQ